MTDEQKGSILVAIDALTRALAFDNAAHGVGLARTQLNAVFGPPRHTPNGYDPRWIAAINAVMEDREVDHRITDLDDPFWDRFIGPMCDAIEYDGALPEYRVAVMA